MLTATSGQYYPLASHTLYGSYVWPVRSPDLSVLENCVLKHMTDMVYQQKSQTREELLQQIKEYADHIKRND